MRMIFVVDVNNSVFCFYFSACCYDFLDFLNFPPLFVVISFRSKSRGQWTANFFDLELLRFV